MSRMRRRPARPLSYDKVLLAVYILADKDGIAARTTCAEIARQAGVSVSTASARLGDLQADGVIDIRGKGRICPRIFLLLDHPQAVEMGDWVRGLVVTEKYGPDIDEAEWLLFYTKAKTPGS